MIIAPYDNISSGSFSGSVAWEDIKGRPDLSNISSMKAIQITLLSSLWEDHEQTVKVEGVLADELPQWIVVSPKKSDEDVYFSANVLCVSQEDDALVFHADSIPEQDISAIVRIFGAADIKEEFSGTFAWWSPKMTSNNTPEPYVISMPDTTNANIYRLFDDDPLTLFQFRIIYLQTHPVVFDFGKTTYIEGIRLTASNEYIEKLPKTFTIEGSNDETKWEEIYQATGDEHPTVSQSELIHEYFFKRSYFRYYRFLFTSIYNTAGGDTSYISDMEFYKLEETT